MPAPHKLKYSCNKVRNGWKPIIRFDIWDEPEEVIEEIREDLVIRDEEEKIEEDAMVRELVDALTKIRKNAKRKLEIFVKTRREDIYNLTDEDRETVMRVIKERFYPRK